MSCERCGNMYTTSSYTCGRCNPQPAVNTPWNPSRFRSPKYDNIAMLEGFLLGIAVTWWAASAGLLNGLGAAAVAFLLTWGAFAVLLMFFPIPVTIAATLVWAVLAGIVAGLMTENNWFWMAGAGLLAGMVAAVAHLRARVVLKG
jgi:hypothetical protein